MKARVLVLRPPSPLTPRVKIEIPSGMKVISDKPRLTSLGVVRVNIAAVHDGQAQFSLRSMLEKVRRSGESPVNELWDLEQILTRGLSVDCDYLVTGIRLHRRFGPFTLKYGLYLSRLVNLWVAHFSLFGLFSDGSRVLCYGK